MTKPTTAATQASANTQTQEVAHSFSRAVPREQEFAAAEMKQLRNRKVDAGKGGKHQRRQQPRRSGHAQHRIGALARHRGVLAAGWNEAHRGGSLSA